MVGIMTTRIVLGLHQACWASIGIVGGYLGGVHEGLCGVQSILHVFFRCLLCISCCHQQSTLHPLQPFYPTPPHSIQVTAKDCSDGAAGVRASLTYSVEAAAVGTVTDVSVNTGTGAATALNYPSKLPSTVTLTHTASIKVCV